MFTIARLIWECDMEYIKPGNVVLTPKILDNSQRYIEEKFKYSIKSQLISYFMVGLVLA